MISAWKCSAAFSLAALLATAAAAQEPPQASIEQQSRASDESDDPIIVSAAPGDQVRIDRRVYTLRDDPVAQTTNLFDILGRVPAVSVAPSGAVTLLGSTDVVVQINGQPAPEGSLEQTLRGLNGDDIERIEVLSNPSAQHSSEGTGGVINIVTRQRFRSQGMSGLSSLSTDSFGGYQAYISPNWMRGPWALGARLNHSSNPSEGAVERTREGYGASPSFYEDGASETDFFILVARTARLPSATRQAEV
ncbi:MAG: TonB-dependent receptor plug domain-containing protein [Terricaulis sp.]|nr:TonB-dependent receptor plug domain-containing protein [Terricaulis sp.]